MRTTLSLSLAALALMVGLGFAAAAKPPQDDLYRAARPDLEHLGVRRNDRREDRHVQAAGLGAGVRLPDGMERLFDLQDRVTASVAGAIEPSITRAEIERSRRKPPESLQAYDLLLKAIEEFRVAQAMETLNELNRLASRRFVTPFCQALVYLGLREDSKAIEWLEKAYQKRSIWVAWLKVEPMYDPLRSNPRFQALYKKMNFPP